MRGRLLSIAVVVSTAALMAACGGGEKATPTVARPAPTATVAAQPTATALPRPTQPPATVAPQPTATPRPQPTATPSGPAGALRVALSTLGTESFIPRQSNPTTCGNIQVPVFDYIIWSTPDGKLAPGVATKWSVSPDGKTWTLDIRQGMVFHDGSPLEAKDVKYTLDQVLAPDSRSPFAGTWRANIASAEVSGPNTVQVAAKAPWVVFPYAASVLEGCEGEIIPKNYVERVSEARFEQSPVGSGPWKFVRQSRGSNIALEAVGAKHPYRPTPSFKNLEVSLIPETTTRVAALKTGAADIVEIGFEETPALRRDGYTIDSIATVTAIQVNIYGAWDRRIQGKPTSNVQVREALALAINRREVLDTLVGGLGKAASRPILVPGSSGYDASWQPVPFDPARSRQLLQGAGYAQGFDVSLYTFAMPGGGWLPRLAEAVAGYWKAVGVNARIVPTDFTAFRPLYAAPNPPNDSIIGQASTYANPAFFSNVVVSSAYYSAKGNIRLWIDDTTERLITQAGQEFDEAKRAGLLRELADYAQKQWTVIPIAFADSPYALSKNVGKWQLIPGFTYIGASFETAERR